MGFNMVHSCLISTQSNLHPTSTQRCRYVRTMHVYVIHVGTSVLVAGVVPAVCGVLVIAVLIAGCVSGACLILRRHTR